MHAVGGERRGGATAGARCRVPYRATGEADGFPHKDRVTLVGGCDLTDEASVARLYEDVTDLWASIHIAGGFAMDKLSETNKAKLMHMLNMNLVTCYLCCHSAVRSFGSAGGRIVNVAARPALEPRLGPSLTVPSEIRCLIRKLRAYKRVLALRRRAADRSGRGGRGIGVADVRRQRYADGLEELSRHAGHRRAQDEALPVLLGLDFL